MGRTPVEQRELATRIQAAKSKVTVGARYQHYKSTEKIYEVIGLGFMESNDELCVIYQAQYGKRLTFIRPLDIWLEHVQWNGIEIPRFTLIEA